MGRSLLQRGVTSARKLAETESRALRQEARLSDAFRLRLAIPAQIIAEVEADMFHLGLINPTVDPPDPRLLARLGPAFALANGVLPWRSMGGETIVLTPFPERIDRSRAHLTETFGPIRLAITTEDHLNDAVRKLSDTELTKRAETQVAIGESCRTWNTPLARRYGLALGAVLASAILVAPSLSFAVAVFWAVFTLTCHMILKATTLCLALLDRQKPVDQIKAHQIRLPIVTVMVPLFKEREIAGHLVSRLAAIDYPHELLDVCLLLEADDQTTQTALFETNLPRWMRAIVVPRGTLKTKPRALNFGLSFARGSIIAVYDAEDRPAPDQIRQVVARFAQSAPDVACLQGVLDFYNHSTNWLARCFTLEYATWFRIVLPGLARLGLVVPLGGTTLFFRRAPLEALGGWDAHNVTEDADLGIRLARHGYRTELINTVTDEEANCRTWPWIKQRSRWLKGYAITYAVHMRNPRQLWADLGAWRFLGIQVIFLGTLSQFTLAPLLWSFWLLPFGIYHPMVDVAPHSVLIALGTLFLLAEVLNVTTAAIAVQWAGKPHLMKWAVTLHLYFPLAAIASYKGLWELFWRPFYWDKTMHGVFLAPGSSPSPKSRQTAASPASRPPQHPV